MDEQLLELILLQKRMISSQQTSIEEQKKTNRLLEKQLKDVSNWMMYFATTTALTLPPKQED